MQANKIEGNLDKETGHLAHPEYRPDIDGLRAVAVLSVVGFHAFPDLVKGGFIGVDIFFVISGFLISTIIFTSLNRNAFSFLEFYGRRIRRIFPALILVLVTCFTLGWFVLFGDEYKQLGNHIAGGAGFVPNLVLWSESGYFDNAANSKPLLHLWSLGIEEQFYIIWPLLLWLAWKKRSSLIAITVTIAVASIAYNIAIYRHDAVADYYSPQTRFWELFAGSVLAYIKLHSHDFSASLKKWLDKWPVQYTKVNSAALCETQSIFGALLVTTGILVITKKYHFPGFWAVLPVFGAVFIISAGKHAWLNRVVLSNRLLVWFGLISFPLYL